MKRLFAILCIYAISHSMAYAGSYLGDPLDPGDPYFYNPTQEGGIAHFQGSQTCGSCHDTTVSQCDYLNQTESCVGNGNPLGHFDKDGNDVSIRRAWSATMMGNSLRDPYFLAKIKKELTRNPDHAQEINTSCTRCHAPMANVDAEVAGTTIDVFDTPSGKGILSVGNIRHDLGMDGVSCSVCHQIQDDPSLGTQDANTGGYKIDTSLVGVNRLMYGPYLNADMYPGPMKNNKALNGALQGTPWYSKHITQSQVCGTCHDVKTPIRDRRGNIVSQGRNEEFPEQMNYTEWFNSDYNTGSDPKTCQQCHMARTNGVYVSTQGNRMKESPPKT